MIPAAIVDFEFFFGRQTNHSVISRRPLSGSGRSPEDRRHQVEHPRRATLAERRAPGSVDDLEFLEHL
jgi:hypothetical protein